MHRIGLGYDSHRFAPQRPLILGGVRIENAPGLVAHSDGDVVLHALTDALLGSIAAGDIGEHFPDSDPALACADSTRFLRRAMELLAERSYRVVNVDLVIQTETPRLSGHKSRIAERIAELLAIEPGQVSVKAKSAEGMGFVGRAEGMTCQAVVLVESAG